MPDGGKHRQRDDVYADRSRDYTHKGRHSRYDNQTQRDVKDAGSADDRRTKNNRNRGLTGPSYKGAPAYRDHQESSRPSTEASEYYSDTNYTHQHREVLYNLRYALTTRGKYIYGDVPLGNLKAQNIQIINFINILGICQLAQLFANLLIIICAGVPYSNNGGYRDLASLGGVYYYYFGGAGAFTGADAQKVQQLDQSFNQLKRPPYIFAMAAGGILMIYACVMFTLGVFRVPYRWPPVLLGEAVLSFLIGLGYIPALAFYFIKIQETYNSAICKEREQMYLSKGHKGFGCQFNGADIAGGLFGVLGVFVFIFSAVLAVRAFRSVRELKKQNTKENDDDQTGISLPRLNSS